MNVESSHCYNDLDAFFEGVSYLLNDKGVFVYIDWRMTKEGSNLAKSLVDEKVRKVFEVVKEEDISQNVIAALLATTEMKMKEVTNRVPSYCKKTIAEFLGVENSDFHLHLKNKRMVYFAYLLKKKSK